MKPPGSSYTFAKKQKMKFKGGLKSRKIEQAGISFCPDLNYLMMLSGEVLIWPERTCFISSACNA